MKNKKWMLTVVAVAIVIVIVMISVCLKSKEINTSKIKMSNTNIIRLNRFELKDRAKLTKGNVIYIGENNKELQNGFYDLKIVLNTNEIRVYLNKLWHKECNESYIEEQYLANICRELVNNLEFSKNKELENKDDLEYVLYKYIMDNYVLIRQGIKSSSIQTDNIIIELENVENIPVLIIRGV